MPSLSHDILAIGATTSTNAVGRVFSLWTTAREAGLDLTYVGVDDGDVWEPVRDTAFPAHVHRVASLADVAAYAQQHLTPSTVLLVAKPLPKLLSLATRVAGASPIVIDVDDPELEARWAGKSLLGRARRAWKEGPTRTGYGWARRFVSRAHVLTSSPGLHALYGGTVVPHVREPDAVPVRGDRTGRPFTVAFVGTPRPHKGLVETRHAMDTIAAGRDASLVVTASAPDDARPWERWVGTTSLADGLALVADADAVVLASRPGSWGDLQFPVKLVDAMVAGVPAVITPRPTLLWAAGGTAAVVRDGAVSDIVDALELLATNRELAASLGSAARQRALATFTPAAAAPALRSAIDRAAGGPR